MSTYDQSTWSPEIVDSLENVDREIQLVSTSSESHSASNNTGESEPVNEEKASVLHSEEGSAKLSHGNHTANNGKSNSGDYFKKRNVKLHSSLDDLRLRSKGNFTGSKCTGTEKNRDINRSATVANFKRTKKSGNQKYDHVQSKIKQYSQSKYEGTQKNLKSSVKVDAKTDKKKEDYLEEINKQLAKELDEKNAILSLLQENYEHLLFKYAEAQNRIDELRFKCMTKNAESKNPCQHFVFNKEDKNHLQCLSNENYANRGSDVKCQRGATMTNSGLITEEQSLPGSGTLKVPVPRPVSLPLENNVKFVERDVIMTKATTPTDSEGLSSIITSMSGHSKILNSLDEENQINKKSNYLKNSTSNFILESNSAVNDPFDKVKNWQNSLPPLEQIETPETALYNVYNPNNADAYSSGETKYNEIASPKNGNDYVFLEDSCPASWRDDNVEHDKSARYNGHGTMSLVNSKRGVKEPSHNNKKIYHPTESGSLTPDKTRQNDRLSGNEEVSLRTRSNDPSARSSQVGHHKQPILRCSSLPAYDQESTKSRNRKNGIYIPPLDLGNVTLSDDECYCQQDYYPNRASASSIGTSRDESTSTDRFIQTPQSFSPRKPTISECNFYTRAPKQTQTTDKSTSITPEKPKSVMNNSTGVDVPWTKNSFSKQECLDCCRSQTQEWCNICGESISEKKKNSHGFFQTRSNSCESVRGNKLNKAGMTQTSERKTAKPPFKRSVSFGSEAITSKYCSHDERVPKSFFPIPSQESLENFDLYASNLKARSQVVMKALTAHINNS